MRYIRAINFKIQYMFIILVKNFYKFSFKLHPLDNKESEILNELEENGYYVGSSEDLNKLNVNTKWKESAKEIINLLDNQHNKTKIDFNKKGSINIMLENIPNSLMQDLYLFALNKSLVKIIENYLKLNLLFRGVAIKKDIIDGREIETRKWHIDGEDNRIIKIIFYLNKVDKSGGPFTCISKKFSKNKSVKKDSNGRIENKSIINAFNKNQINQFIGDIENFIIVDTCSVLHKGELPLSKNRYVVFFCYNSLIPTQPKFCKNLNPSFIGKFQGNYKNKITPKV